MCHILTQSVLSQYAVPREGETMRHTYRALVAGVGIIGLLVSGQFLIVGMFLLASADPVWADDQAASVDPLKARAARGDAEAQNDLGVTYATGQGVAQGYTEALKWFRLAAAQGLADAQYC